MKWLIDQNYFIGIGAFAQVVGTFLFINSLFNESIWYAIAILLATKVVYSLLRASDSIKQKAIQKKLILENALPAILSVVAIYLAGISIAQIIVLLIGLFIAGLYGMHAGGGLLKQFSLRKQGWVKMMSIGLVWSLITVVVPLLFSGIAIQLKHYLFILAQFLFVLLLTLPFDKSHAIREETLGFTTVPRLLGEQLTMNFARALGLSVWIIFGFIALPWFYAMSICLLLFLYFFKQDASEWNFNQFTLHFDSLLIIEPILVAIFLQLL